MNQLPCIILYHVSLTSHLSLLDHCFVVHLLSSLPDLLEANNSSLLDERRSNELGAVSFDQALSSRSGIAILEASWWVLEIGPLSSGSLLASHVPASVWLVGVVLSCLDSAVLVLGHLVLVGWDLEVDVLNWIVDGGWLPVSVLLGPAELLHSSLVLAKGEHWGCVGLGSSLDGVMALASGSDGVAQVICKGDVGLAEGRRAVGKLDPSSSHARAGLGGYLSETSSVGDVVDVGNAISEPLVHPDSTATGDQGSNYKRISHY